MYILRSRSTSMRLNGCSPARFPSPCVGFRSRVWPRNFRASAASTSASEQEAAGSATEVDEAPKAEQPVVEVAATKVEEAPKADPAPAAAATEKSMVEELLDPKAFGSRGEGWVAAQVAASALVLLAPSPITAMLDSLATLSILVGAGLLTVSIVNMGKNVTPLPAPRDDHELVVSGAYAYARHPMYGGVLLLALGLSVLTHSETRLAATALLWWILENKVTLEEQALSDRYPEYTAYKSKVKKFFPFVY